MSGEPVTWQEMRDDGIAPDLSPCNGVWSGVFVVDPERPFGHDGVVVAAQVGDTAATRSSRRQAYQVSPDSSHVVSDKTAGGGWSCLTADSTQVTATAAPVHAGQRALPLHWTARLPAVGPARDCTPSPGA